MPPPSAGLTAQTSPSESTRGDHALPAITSPLSTAEVVDRLEQTARRGKLPGFHRGPAPASFTLTDFGNPCESVLDGRTRPSGSGSEIDFELRLKPATIWITAIVGVLTVWPGVWLTDSMIRTYFPGYATTVAEHPWLATWVWYFILTVPSVPWSVWYVVRKSRRTGREEAGKLIERVRAIVAPG